MVIISALNVNICQGLSVEDVLKKSGGKGGAFKTEGTYTYGRFILIYGKKLHNIEK